MEASCQCRRVGTGDGAGTRRKACVGDATGARTGRQASRPACTALDATRPTYAERVSVRRRAGPQWLERASMRRRSDCTRRIHARKRSRCRTCKSQSRMTGFSRLGSGNAGSSTSSSTVSAGSGREVVRAIAAARDGEGSRASHRISRSSPCRKDAIPSRSVELDRGPWQLRPRPRPTSPRARARRANRRRREAQSCPGPGSPGQSAVARRPGAGQGLPSPHPARRGRAPAGRSPGRPPYCTSPMIGMSATRHSMRPQRASSPEAFVQLEPRSAVHHQHALSARQRVRGKFERGARDGCRVRARDDVQPRGAIAGRALRHEEQRGSIAARREARTPRTPRAARATPRGARRVPSQVCHAAAKWHRDRFGRRSDRADQRLERWRRAHRDPHQRELARRARRVERRGSAGRRATCCARRTNESADASCQARQSAARCAETAAPGDGTPAANQSSSARASAASAESSAAGSPLPCRELDIAQAFGDRRRRNGNRILRLTPRRGRREREVAQLSSAREQQRGALDGRAGLGRRRKVHADAPVDGQRVAGQEQRAHAGLAAGEQAGGESAGARRARRDHGKLRARSGAFTICAASPTRGSRGHSPDDGRDAGPRHLRLEQRLVPGRGEQRDDRADRGARQRGENQRQRTGARSGGGGNGDVPGAHRGVDDAVPVQRHRLVRHRGPRYARATTGSRAALAAGSRELRPPGRCPRPASWASGS